MRRESRRRCQIDKTVGEVETATDPIQELIDAVNSQEPVNGFTHKYYRYPARFSPLFPRAVIRAFTEPGDVVLDPFMGSGTTLVEALTQGRRAVGSDVNSLATFLATVKTSTLSENDLETVIEWADALPDHLNLHSPAARAIEWKEAGYQVHLPWRHRKTIEFILDRLQVLPRRRQQRFVRGVLLKLSQWALDCRQHIPSIPQFREEFYGCLNLFLQGMREYREAVLTNRLPDGRKPTAACLQKKASELAEVGHLASMPAKLVVTSPPYPGVYVLYHRWKVRGRKETPAPYWLADCRDGQGQAYYCFGDRRIEGLPAYFDGIRESFTGVRQVVDPDALVVQMVSFKEPDWQIPAYLDAMNDAGFVEIMPRELGIAAADRLWRDVPGRRWFALIQGSLATSQEVVLFHRPS